MRRHIYPALLVLAALSGGCHAFPRGEIPGELAASGEPAAERKLELPPAETAQVCLATAEMLDQNGKDVAAVALYEKARRSDPTKAARVCRRLAVLYDRLGEFKRAGEEYELALQMFPKDPDVWNDRGYSLYCRGNWEEAEKHFRKALALSPNHPHAWNNLGMALGQQQRYEESLEAFGKVVAPAEAECNLAFILTSQGKREEAKAEYRKALAIDPELRLARAALAKLEAPAPSPGEPEPSAPGPRAAMKGPGS